MSVLKAAGLIAVISLISKLVGLVREQVIAAYYGTGYVTDAYSIAYLLPAAFALVMLAGLNGPFHSGIVSVIAKYKARNETKEIKEIIFTIVVLSSLFMGMISLLCYHYAPEVVRIIARSAIPPETSTLAVKQLQIMCPIFFLSALIGISYGILNIEKVYLTPSLSPVMASLAIIVALFFSSPENRPVALAWGTTCGAFLQLILQLIPLLKYLKNYLGFSFRPSHPGVKMVFAILLPASLSSIVGQVNVIITTYFASGLDKGSIAALRFGNFLIQLPLGVMLTALLVPVLPMLNESITRNDEKKSFFRLINKSIRSLIFLSVPATIILALSGKQLVQLLFQRGAFDYESTMLTYKVLLFYSIGIIFYAIRDLFVRVFYALDNAKTPFYTSLFSIIVMTFFCWFFTDIIPLYAGGIAFAVSMVTIFNLVLLWFLLNKKIGKWLEKETITHFLRTLLASIPLICGTVLFNYLSGEKLTISLFISWGLTITVLGIIYITTLRYLKDQETIEISDKFIQKFKRFF